MSLGRTILICASLSFLASVLVSRLASMDEVPSGPIEARAAIPGPGYAMPAR